MEFELAGYEINNDNFAKKKGSKEIKTSWEPLYGDFSDPPFLED